MLGKMRIPRTTMDIAGVKKGHIRDDTNNSGRDPISKMFFEYGKGARISGTTQTLQDLIDIFGTTRII